MDVDREAKGRDRRAATRKVEEALARGRIVAADADLRMMQIESAAMVSDLDRLVRDLDPAVAADPWASTSTPTSTPTPPPTSTTAPASAQRTDTDRPPTPAGPSPAPVTADPSSAPPRDAGVPAGPVFAGPAPSSRPPGGSGAPWAPGAGPVMKPRKRRKTSPVAILVVGTALTASFLARGGSDSSVDEATGIGSASDGMLTEWGFRDVVTAVEARTGDTEVLDLTLYPTYAEVVVPDEPRGRTGSRFRYGEDGLQQQGGAVVRGARLDLAVIDARAVTVAVREAEALLAEPAGTYVEVVPGRRGPSLRTVAGDGGDGLVVVESTADGRIRSVTGP
ncbi:hypothetical protein G7072_17465 [Nocardioides sp. HDW12B]|uniref:hypothetical protein n=1 Tax=Nocardioides sp. HDW12B TaxID=2714939 RepID=UPI0014094FD0|nr:hypothetical protein [Nocardioides sp. HDW12B]QIK67897.1 hypothetical protein G7072_17465 [Nocardioides sp. HDW12B]